MKSIGHLFIFVFVCWTLVDCQDSTTTTAEETTTTTPVSTTTMAPVTTTEMPEGNWTVLGENGTICIMAQMHLQLVLQYNTSSGMAEKTLHLENAKVNDMNSSCENGLMELEFQNGKLQFHFAHENKKVFLSNITLHVVFDNETFPNVTEKDHDYSAVNQRFFEVSDGSSFLCNVNEDLALSENSKLIVDHVQVEAFAKSDGTFSSAEECEQDEGDVSEIVPIAVGCALAGLVVIVLIAYLVGRRHKRQKGYESV